MNSFEQIGYQATLQACSYNHKHGVPYIEHLRVLIVQTERYLPDVAGALRDHAVYAEWQQVYNDPETTKNLDKLTEQVFEVLMKHLGYKEYVLDGQRGWNVRVKTTGVTGMGWTVITLENLQTGKSRKGPCIGAMPSIAALEAAFNLQRYLAEDFTYWTGEA